jgi:DNA-binding NtrC family response regulator
MTVTKRVDCVEDEQDTRDMMGVSLSRYSSEAVNAASVADALENDRHGELALAYLIIG